MSLNVVSLFNSKSSFRSHDWTDQELAEFYRVEASLIRANIPIETDRGLTDEGDPWFLFSNANTGEIIVHFARFDGSYVVASPALERCAKNSALKHSATRLVLLSKTVMSKGTVLRRRTLPAA